MIKPNIARILWLTDIHCSTDYLPLENVKQFKKFITGITHAINSEYDKEQPIDYLFITGDLAQTGIAKDYDAFLQLFLEPILRSLLKPGIPIPKVVGIPGNHDVCWTFGDFFNEFISFLLPGIQEGERAHFLDEREDKFEKLFEFYSDFMARLASHETFSTSFNFPESEGYFVSEDYTKKYLHGFIVDHRKRLIIILFNSAWFSLGGKSQALFADEILKRIRSGKKGSSPVSKADVTNWLKKQDLISEYNHQMTGVAFMKTERLDEYFEEYPDYFTIAAMHHPRNWLDWGEYYSYEPDKINNAFKFNKLLQRTDLLLTGHEHIPQEVESEMIMGNTLHLKGGCFLFDSQKPDELKLKHCWFSVLEIDTEKRFVIQQKYSFDDTVGIEQWRRKSAGHACPPFIAAFALSRERADAVERLMLTGGDDRLKHYLEHYLERPDYFLDWHRLKEISNADCYVYHGMVTGHEELCMLARKLNFYEDTMLKESFNELIKSLAEKFPQVEVIRIVCPDLFVIKAAFDRYHEKKSRELVFGGIVRQADNLFDVFRVRFFTHFEQPLRDSMAGIMLFKKLSKLRFVNHIIPYWTCERFWL